jgi:hypothetical protein
MLKWGSSNSARGMLVFDSSGKGTAPVRGIAAVSPHLDPLPKGEETGSIAWWKADNSGLFAA